MGRTVLVTGATGNVGIAVMRALAETDFSARALVRSPGRARAQLDEVAPGSEVVAGSFDGNRPGPELFDGVEGIFLLRPPAVGDVERLMFPFLHAAREAGVRRVVLLSLLGAQKMPFVPHRKLEKEIDRLGFDRTFLRAGFFMQNLDGLFRDFIREDDLLPAPAGRSRTSFVDARDLGEAAARLLSDLIGRSGSFELTGVDSLTYSEVAEELSRRLGREIVYPASSRGEFSRLALEKGWDPNYVKVVSRLFITVRLGLAAKVTDELPSLLGREPRRIGEYIEDYLGAWR